MVPSKRVNDSITWAAGPKIHSAAAPPKRAKKITEHVVQKEPTPVIGGVGGEVAADVEEEDDEPALSATVSPLMDWSLNRKISEANARFNKMRQEKESVAPKSGLRKAFEQLVSETGSQLAVDGPTMTASQKKKGPPIPPQPSLRSFLNIPPPPSEASGSEGGSSSV